MDYLKFQIGITSTTSYKCYDVEFVGTQTSSVNNDIVASITFYGNLGTVGVTAYMRSIDGGTTWDILPNHPALNHSSSFYTIETSKAFPNFIFTLNSNQLRRFDKTPNIPNSWKNIGFVSITEGDAHGFGVDNMNGTVHFSYGINYGNYKYNSSNDTYNSLSSRGTTHDDNEDFVCHPTMPNIVWCANHGGVAKSIDGGLHWLDKSDGLGVAEMQQAAFSTEDGTSILAGLYHDGSVLSTTNYSSTNWNPDWKTVAWGDGNATVIDNKNSNYMCTSTQINWFSTNNKYVSSFAIEDYGSYYTNEKLSWDNTMVLDKANPATFFRTTTHLGSQEIIRSFNRGVIGSNFAISNFNIYLKTLYPSLSNYHIWRIYTPEAESNQKYLLAHILINGVSHLFRTKIFDDPNAANVIASWEELPLPSNGWCGQITFDATNANLVYVPYGTYNYANNPTGKNMLFELDYTNPSAFTYNFANDPTNTVDPNLYLDLTRNLPDVSGGGFAIDKYSNRGMYFATDVGVFYTNLKMLDNGTNWIPFGVSLPNTGTKGLNINYATNKLRSIVWGRGAWQHDLYCPTDINLTEATTYTATNYLEAQNTITSTATVPNALSITYRAGTEIELADGFSAVEGAEFGAFIHSCNTPYTNSFRKANPATNYITNTETQAMPQTQAVQLHPNPTSGILYITATEGNLHYVLKNITSSTLKQGRITNNQLSIAEYPAGLYLLQLTNVNGVSTIFKVVKE